MAPPPIVLAAADYWELRARLRDVEVARQELRVAMTAVDSATHDYRACFERLAAQHALGDTTFTWDDTTCTLLPTPAADNEPQEVL